MRNALVALAVLVALPAAAGAEPARPQALRFDPFAEAPQPDAVGARSVTPDAAAAWRPLLRATLAAGPESLADLGGVVLSIGGETRGYRLLEVRPWEAVFEKDGANVVLPVQRQERE